LIDLLEHTGKQYTAYLQTLNPFEPAIFPVAWAGEEQSAKWFHIAREYTEKWHHQQQIRLAVNQPAPLMTRELFYPCIATFMQALPHTYRQTEAPQSTLIKVVVNGQAGGQWYLEKAAHQWQFVNISSNIPAQATVYLEPDVAWMLLTKAITPEQAQPKSVIIGDANLANPVFGMLSVMA
jgi:hypothetical protein